MDFEFVWRIENYSAVLHDLEEEVRSPSFYADPFCEVKWFLSIESYDSPTDNNNNDETNNYISCFLNRDEDEGISDPVSMNFTIEALGHDEHVFYSYAYENCEFSKADSNGCDRFAKVCDITYILGHKTNNTLIIRCKLIIDQLPLFAQNRITTNTNICVDKHSFPWSVKYSEGQNWSAKKNFDIPEQTPLEVTMCTINDNVSITIIRDQELPFVSQYITCYLQWLDSKDKLVLLENHSYLFSCKKINDIWKFPTSLTKNQLQNLTHSATHRLKLVFCFFVSNGVIINIYNKFRYTYPGFYPLCYLQQFSPLFLDLKALCVKRSSCDVWLRVEDHIFPAHLSVLCVRALAFSEFVDETISMNCIEIEVPDVNAFIFKTFLSYVYTGKVNFVENIKDILDLLKFADTYDIELLEGKCVTYLMGILTKENVLEIFVGAAGAHCTLLQDEIYSFLLQNLDFFKSPQWQHFSKNHTELADLILRSVDYYVPC